MQRKNPLYIYIKLESLTGRLTCTAYIYMNINIDIDTQQTVIDTIHSINCRTNASTHALQCFTLICIHAQTPLI